MNRRARLPGFFAALALLAALGLWWRQRPPTGTPALAVEAPPAPPPPAGPPDAGRASAPEEAAVPVEQLPQPQCWNGLLALDQARALGELRTALEAAAGRGDELLATYLRERLAERVGADPEAALEVISWAEQASQPGLYLEALKSTPAVQQPRVAERLLQLGERAGAPPALRRSALETLETQQRLGAEPLSRLQALALEGSTGELAGAATRTLGQVMKNDFERTSAFEPYWDALLDIGRKSPDTAVRLMALEMPTYSNPLPGGASLDTLATILQKDPDRAVREMAALRLSLTREPARALELYGQAFPLEQDLCVRWAIFRFAARAAGARALPLLEKFAAQDARLRADYEDFRDLYETGAADFSRVWLGKPERHPCNNEGGAP